MIYSVLNVCIPGLLVTILSSFFNNWEIDKAGLTKNYSIIGNIYYSTISLLKGILGYMSKMISVLLTLETIAHYQGIDHAKFGKG